MNKKKCSLHVLSDDGKMLHGTAAQLYYISQNGGWDTFMEKTASDAAKLAVEHTFKEMKKAQFKTLNGNRRRKIS